MDDATQPPGRDKPALRVVDFSRHQPGPVASRLLVDLGADVVKIENPRTGDGNRGLAPQVHGKGLLHVALNAGTRSLALDRRSPHWQRVVQAAARWADVVIVGGLPESQARLGLGFETLVGANPALVHCSITGYGETGPWRSLPAHGLNPDAFAGLVPLEWQDGLPQPHPRYLAVSAPLAGIFAALGIMAALRRRDSTGEAQRVQASLFGAALWWNWRHLSAFANLGVPWGSYGAFGGRYATYPTGDGKVILVCPVERPYWEAFCELLDLPEAWKARGSWEASGLDHGTNYPEERPEIARRMAQQPLDHWVAEFTRARIPFAPILDFDEVLASEHVAANHLMREVKIGSRTARIPSPPIALSSARGALAGELLAAPELGMHSEEILRDFGLEDLVGPGQ